MGIVIQTLATYAPWIYAICGLAALYQLYRIWAVRAERKQAVFSLEREKAVQDTYSIFAVALALVVTMGLTSFVSNTLAQAVEPLVAGVSTAVWSPDDKQIAVGLDTGEVQLFDIQTS